MAKGNKVFDTEISGFNKKQVNEYIEKLVSQYQQTLNEKVKECDSLKAKNEQLTAKINELSNAYISAQSEKAKIADVLINAENTAKNIIAQAETDSAAERQRLSLQADDKRMLIVDMNQKIRNMKQDMIVMLDGFSQDVDSLMSSLKNSIENEKDSVTKAVDDINNKYDVKEEE